MQYTVILYTLLHTGSFNVYKAWNIKIYLISELVAKYKIIYFIQVFDEFLYNIKLQFSRLSLSLRPCGSKDLLIGSCRHHSFFSLLLSVRSWIIFSLKTILKRKHFFYLAWTNFLLLKIQSCKLYNAWLCITNALNKCMIVSPHITHTEIFAFITILVFKLLSRKVLFINWKDNRNC